MAVQPSDKPPDPAALASALERLEVRLARIEAYLRLDTPAGAAGPAAPAGVRNTEEELEFKIGQEWFARVGIAALAIGVAFTLSLPYPSLPPVVPSLIGYVLVAGLFALVRFSPRQFELVSRHLRATAMALGYFASLRLCFFGERHALSADAAAGGIVLTLAAGANLAIALRRKSPGLFGLALFTGYATALAVGSPGFGLGLVALFSIAAVAAGVRLGRPAPILIAMPFAYAAYFVWALNNPFLGRPVQVVAGPAWAPAVLLVCLVAFSRGLRRSIRGGERENTVANVGVFLNALAGYTLYLGHTLACFDARLVGAQLAAAGVLIGLAILHAREKDVSGSFICAMTGFLALSFAIIKATEPPDVFVWLSLQSVIVVATAIWLRSRFIVVANFVIYLVILAGYVAVARQEHGISIGFGLVALATARLLGWKQKRLELKTELMRNAYLATAFLIFPYALFHLVPGAWVSLAWVGAALLYYLLAAILHNRKYRWMGHATLLLTALYLAIVGISRLEPLFRNLSLLVLGAVLLIVSLVFTRLRARRP
ncbi:MAG TPA: hypothetical protein VMI53_00570 [Opitutaceae bacterium]|nr:hypothetical protein [Opitutaceae bacterium]